MPSYLIISGTCRSGHFLLPHFRNEEDEGCLGGSVVEHLPLAQVVILGSWDRIPHRAPHGELCLSLPLSLCVSHELKKKKNLNKERNEEGEAQEGCHLCKVPAGERHN